MPYITVGRENSGNIEISYEDHGSGRPVVLIHGYPLNGASWEKQVPPLLEAGFRVVTYDRRGFGKSSQPTAGYDYNTLSQDLHNLMTALGLRECTLVGFSMGAGEVARYLRNYGSQYVRSAVIISGITPCLVKSADNPRGVDASVFAGIQKAVTADRFAFLTEFLNNFYNADLLQGKRVSQQAVQASWNVAATASPTASVECVAAWREDFRGDLASIDVPTLVVHGDSDRIVPISIGGESTAKAVKGARLAVVKNGPHGLTWTHPDEVAAELLTFLPATGEVSRAVA